MVLTSSSSQNIKKLKRPKPIYFCTDMNNEVLYKNFKKRGWVEVTNISGMWNFYWTSMTSFRRIILSPSYHLRNDQIVNHFPNSYEFSRKDLLLKHFKNYRKRLEQSGDPIAEKLPKSSKLDLGGTRYKYLNFLPQTFILPMEYNMFVEEFNKSPQCTWIIKPSGKSQGVGIFLVNKLVQLKKWSYESRNFFQMPQITRDYYVISKYIESPLLIHKKKFDIRLYVLVSSFNPIKAFLYNEGFCRFCSEKYDKSLTNLTNLYAHLTNVSIQKNNVDAYNQQDGGKCSLDNLWDHLNKTFGKTTKDLCIDNIINLIRHTLRAVAPVISSDRHCFELYGFDIIIDGRAKPWLIEVNSSPSIVGTTNEDAALKTRLIDNVLKVVLPSSGIPDAKWDKNPSVEASANFIVLINEGASNNDTLNQESLKVNKLQRLQKPTIIKTKSHWYSSRSLAGSFRARMKTIIARISHGKTKSISSRSRMKIAPRKGNSKEDEENANSMSSDNLTEKKEESDDTERSATSESSIHNVLSIPSSNNNVLSIPSSNNNALSIPSSNINVVSMPSCNNNVLNVSSCNDNVLSTPSETTNNTTPKKMTACLDKGQLKTCNKTLKKTTISDIKTISQKTQKKLSSSEQDTNKTKKSSKFAKPNPAAHSIMKVKSITVNKKTLNNNSKKITSDLKDSNIINNNVNKIKHIEKVLTQLRAPKKNPRSLLSKPEMAHSRLEMNDRRKLLDPEKAINMNGTVIKTILPKKNSIIPRTNTNNLNSAIPSINIRKPSVSTTIGNKKSVQSKSVNKDKKKTSNSNMNYTTKTVSGSNTKKKSVPSKKTNSRMLPAQNGAAVKNIAYIRKPINASGNKKLSHSRIEKSDKGKKSSDSGYSEKLVVTVINKKPICSRTSNKSIKKKPTQSISCTNPVQDNTTTNKVPLKERKSTYSSEDSVNKHKFNVNSNTLQGSTTTSDKRSSNKATIKKHSSTMKTSRPKQIKQKSKNDETTTTKQPSTKNKEIMNKKNIAVSTCELPNPNATAGPLSIDKSINVIHTTKPRKSKKKKAQLKPSSTSPSNICNIFDYDEIHRRTKNFVFQN